MNKDRPFSEFARMLPQLLENGEEVSVFPKGNSMLPTIRPGDKVTLLKPVKIRKYDILLFILPDGKAILHRLIAVRRDGSYVLRGDTQSVKETGITDADIVAKVKTIEKNGKIIKAYGFLFYLRSFLVLNLKYIKRIIKRLLFLS